MRVWVLQSLLSHRTSRRALRKRLHFVAAVHPLPPAPATLARDVVALKTIKSTLEKYGYAVGEVLGSGTSGVVFAASRVADGSRYACAQRSLFAVHVCNMIFISGSR